MVAIWDLWVRLFHWSLVAAIAVLFVSGETSIGFYDWHRVVGEFVMALVVFRLLWSVFGSSNASLLKLIRPVAALRHMKDLAQRNVAPERGHNAAGGLAVLAMLTLISVQAISGFFIADEDELIEGAFYGVLSEETTDWLYTVHTTNSTLLQVLVGVHIITVLVYLLYARQNLISAMFTGKMKWPDGTTIPEIKQRSFVTGLVIAAAVASLMLKVVGFY